MSFRIYSRSFYFQIRLSIFLFASCKLPYRDVKRKLLLVKIWRTFVFMKIYICSIVGKRPKTAAEPYTKWREPLRRRVHQCVVGLFKWKVLWKEPAWPWPRGFGTCVRWDEKRQRDAKGRVGWDASENECKRCAVWVEKRERASANAEDESYRVARVISENWAE